MSLVQHFGYFGQGCLVSEYPPAFNKGTNFEEIIQVGNYSLFPFQVSLAEAMRLFWGVKKWKVSYRYNYEVNLDRAVNPDTFGSNITTGSYVKTSGNILISGESGDSNYSGYNSLHSAENETQLLCRAQEPETVMFREQWSFPVTYERRRVRIIDEETGETMTENDTIEENLPFYITNDVVQVEFLPPFSKSENPNNLNLWMLFDVFVTRRLAAGYVNFIENPVGSIDASLDYLGTTKTIKLGSAEPNQPAGEWVIRNEISDVLIEPLEWWTYNGKFNSETGFLV